MPTSQSWQVREAPPQTVMGNSENAGAAADLDRSYSEVLKLQRICNRRAGSRRMTEFSVSSQPGVFLLLAALLLAVSASSSAAGEVLELQAAKDNTLYQDSGGNLSNGAGGGIFAGSTRERLIRRALLAFNLSSIPSTATVNSVSLRLVLNNPNNQNSESRTVSLHRVLQDWGEGSSNADGAGGQGGPAAAGDATWRHTFFDTDFWSSSGGDFSPSPSASLQVAGNGTYTWQSTPELVADVQNWVEDPASNFGWLLRGEEGGAQTAKRFRSRHNSASSAPMLRIDYTATTQDEGSLVLVFPQFVNGQTGADLNKSRIILRNNNDLPAIGTIRFRASQTGGPSQPTSVPIDGRMVESVNYELEPWGTIDIETDGTGALFTGVAEVFAADNSSPLDSHLSDSDLEGTEVFSLLGNFVSVDSSKPQSSQQIYVSRNASEGTGLAIYNPGDEEAAVLDLVLLDDRGELKATKQISVLPRQHMALFVDEDTLFREFFQQNPGNFEGTLNIHVSSGEDVSIVALLQKKANGALIAVSPSSDAFNPQP